MKNGLRPFQPETKVYIRSFQDSKLLLPVRWHYNQGYVNKVINFVINKLKY